MSYQLHYFKPGEKIFAEPFNVLERQVRDNTKDIEDMKNELATAVNDVYEENGNIYFLHNDEILAVVAAGSGGGGTATSEMTMTNTTGWANATVSSTSSVNVSINWSSTEDGMSTGDGTLTVTVNKIIKAVKNVAQGDFTIDLKDYLSAGSNQVKLQIADAAGNTRHRSFNITSVAISLSSSFDSSVPQTGNLAFRYTPNGAIEKVVHFVLDGTELETVTTTSTGREMTYAIEKQSHGVHTLSVYFTAMVEGNEVRSNQLDYEVIWIDEEATTPIISSSYNTPSVGQYTTINIPYVVYTPATTSSDVTISVDGDEVAAIRVDRSQQVFSYRMDEVGDHTIVIASGTAEKVIILNVTEVDVNVEAETENLELYLTSASRSNSAPDRDVWKYNDIAATFNNFTWTNADGWHLDNDGVVALRVANGATVTIPYQIFGTNISTTGATIEVEFATHDVLDMDAVIFSCFSGNRGLQITSQKCTLQSMNMPAFGTQFKNDEHVRVSFVIEANGNRSFRRVYCYINGVCSGCVQYGASDNFRQLEPVGIIIGNEKCAIDVYNIRVYSAALPARQMVDNMIADTQNGEEMLRLYTHNDLYDSEGSILLNKLPNDLPYMIVNASELPQYKGDKKTLSGQFVHPLDPDKSFTFEGAQWDVQGTSSQYYYRKNYKVKYKKGFVMSNGVASKVYQLTDKCIPTSTFCYKADVASSEGANNVELVRLYNEACPYKTPAQVENDLVRQGIDGYPIVMFWNDTGNNGMYFLGKHTMLK